MTRYEIGCDPGPLEAWPFDNPDSEYEILAGVPRASGRLDMGAAREVTRAGIWRCTAGRFACIELGDEMMTVLSGRGQLVYRDTGKVVDMTPGDTLFIKGGARVIWEIEEDLTKAFFGYTPNGF